MHPGLKRFAALRFPSRASRLVVLSLSVVGVAALVAGSAYARVAAPAGAEASTANAKKKPPKSIVYSANNIARCKKANASVKVGGLFELSGALVSFGGPSLVGVQLAQKEANRTGGFLVGKKCYKLDLSIQDNRSDPTADVAAARGLINDQKVKFLLGPDSGVFAGNDQAISQGTNPPIIHISPTSAWQSNGYMGAPSKLGLFRSGLEQNLTSADFFKGIRAALPGAKTVYFLFRDDDTSKSLVASYLAKAAVLQGFEIVGSDRYPPGTTDFSSELSRIKSRNPDVIMVGYVVPDITAVARQASQLGINIPIAGWGGGVSIALQGAVNWTASDSVRRALRGADDGESTDCGNQGVRGEVRGDG